MIKSLHLWLAVKAVFLSGMFLQAQGAESQDLNELIVDEIKRMPQGGVYARYQKTQTGREFDDLYQTVDDLDAAIKSHPMNKGRLKITPNKSKAGFSFCSSATYLLFVGVLEKLQAQGLRLDPKVTAAIGEVGDSKEVIHGKLDGIGIFGHWNADGPGTAVLFHRLGLGTNFTQFDKAIPGDFLKIFWNDQIGKGESGHLVVYLGASADGSKIKVWSSNLKNENGSSGYGTMWVEKSRITRALFSRLQTPENLNRWKDFTEADKRSDYLIRIRETGSTADEMREVTGVTD